LTEEDQKENLVEDKKGTKIKPAWVSIRFSFVAHLNELVRVGNKTAGTNDPDMGKGGP